MAFAVVSLAADGAVAGVFDPPSTTSLTNRIFGLTPSGIAWSAVATGTALPVRTTTSGFNGAPGAVVYFNVDTGQLQLDPKGLDVSIPIITYTSGSTNITAANPGPFVYASGTGTSAYSPTTGASRTFPAVTAVTGLAPTTFAARVGLALGSPFGPTLATSGDAGNFASTNGWLNQPWSFPLNMVGSVNVPLSTMVMGNFKTFLVTGANANEDVLGYGIQTGVQFGVFQYGINGVTGNQLGAVIPVTVAVPEPAALSLAGAGMAGLAVWLCRRRRFSSVTTSPSHC